jgi:TRAP-type C4-dicarboxylate transport system substrate-binding protein
MIMKAKDIRRKAFCLLFLVAAVGYFFSGTPAFAQAESKKIYELSLGHHMGMSTPMHTKAFMPFKEDLEKFSNGRIKMTVYPGGALAKPQDAYNQVTKGVMDFAMFVPVYTPGMFPLCDVVSLPFAIPTAEIGLRVIKDLHQRKLLDKELYTGKGITWTGTTSPYQLFLGRKKVTKMEDLKGLKLRIPGGLLGDAMIKLGATPASVPAGEFTTAIERGVVDGGIVAFSSGLGYKMNDMCKYVVRINAGVIILALTANKKMYEGLPKDLQNAVDRAADNFLLYQARGAFDDMDKEALEVFKKTQPELLELEPAEKERWLKTCEPIYGKWISDLEKKGLPANKLYAEFKKLLEGQGVKLPR